MSPRVSRTVYCTAALLGACLFVVLLLARPDMSTARKVFTYKVVHARLDVEETAKYVTSGPGRWDASAHHHDVPPEEGDLSPLPSSLPRSGGSVFALSDEIVDGSETLIDSQGKKDPCSGVVSSQDSGGITVKVKPHGDGKLMTIWEIPHDFSSDDCGVVYDQFGGTFLSRHVVGGDIGDHKLVLTIKDSAKRRKQQPSVTYYQTLKWTGRVVLVRFGHR